jgi:uncharacterized protein (DUF433 family)
MANLLNCTEITVNPNILSGQPVFKGTRVPVAAFFENLKDGISVNEFLELFPGVKKTQLHSLLNCEINSLHA